MYVGMHIWVCVCNVRMCEFMSVCIYVGMYVCMYVLCVCMYVCIYIYIYECKVRNASVFTYICMQGIYICVCV
jgi:hypothetical protein